jgi:ADP-ribose pyrophosphatase
VTPSKCIAKIASMEPPPIQNPRTVFEGAKFSVEDLEVVTESGPVRRERIVHPGAVVLLPILADGRYVLIRNGRFAIGQTLWELAAGTLEINEDPVICAGRELVEETGYRAGTLKPLCVFYSSPGICTEQMHAFLATDLEHVGQQLEAVEQIEPVALEPSEVLAMIRDGRIQDGKTIATLLYHHTFAV